MTSVSSTTDLFEYYRIARTWIEISRFAHELRWQAALRPAEFSESNFLCEYAWVVLNSGFREATVRRHFDYISLCYCDWQSAAEIFELGDICIGTAATAFGNVRKLEAITCTAGIIRGMGFDAFKLKLVSDFFEYGRTLPFIGPVTVQHLAKNLGIDAAKPDRHLTRLADRFGYETVKEMCSAISGQTGDSLSVTDLVLWRFEEQVGVKQITLA